MIATTIHTMSNKYAYYDMHGVCCTVRWARCLLL